jgi:Protein of unknown function (DUF2384)
MTALLHASQSSPARGVVLTKAVLAAADRLGLTARALSRIIGVSEPTVSRMKRGDLGLEEGTKPFELAALLVRAFRSLDAVTGGDERVARAWVQAENLALGGVPGAMMSQVQGLCDVVAYLDARRAPL